MKPTVASYLVIVLYECNTLFTRYWAVWVNQLGKIYIYLSFLFLSQDTVVIGIAGDVCLDVFSINYKNKANFQRTCLC